jgi:hypothetical protein
VIQRAAWTEPLGPTPQHNNLEVSHDNLGSANRHGAILIIATTASVTAAETKLYAAANAVSPGGSVEGASRLYTVDPSSGADVTAMDFHPLRGVLTPSGSALRRVPDQWCF